jgi:hypothetical protein
MAVLLADWCACMERMMGRIMRRAAVKIAIVPFVAAGLFCFGGAAQAPTDHSATNGDIVGRVSTGWSIDPTIRIALNSNGAIPSGRWMQDELLSRDGSGGWGGDAYRFDDPVSQIIRNMAFGRSAPWGLWSDGSMISSALGFHRQDQVDSEGIFACSPRVALTPPGSATVGGSLSGVGFGPLSANQGISVAPVSSTRESLPSAAGGSAAPAGRESWQDVKPAAVVPDVPRPQSAASAAIVEKGLFSQLWPWRQIIIALPGACGLILLLGHLLLRALRWYWLKGSVAGQSWQAELEIERTAQSPFIARLVEREHRRAVERARAREERRRAGLAKGKKDVSRAA